VAAPATFSERLATRSRLWWGAPWPGGRRPGDALHRLGERRARRSREDPDDAWRCCDFWPRTVVDKWNGREFAARHGCRLPELYWWGGPLSRPPLRSLPSRFVVRPVMGTDHRGVLVVVDGTELLRRESATTAELRTRLSPLRRLARPVPILIEEFIALEEGANKLPLEYKCHVFGDTVAAVQMVEREGIHGGRHRWYTREWKPIEDQMNVRFPQTEVRDPPRCLEPMVDLATRMGKDIGTYMRIDFFAGDEDCVFNEFSSVPGGGVGHTPYCDSLFGALWAERCPDRS
jgi:TupA-like ATPgrasp